MVIPGPGERLPERMSANCGLPEARAAVTENANQELDAQRANVENYAFVKFSLERPQEQQFGHSLTLAAYDGLLTYPLGAAKGGAPDA